MSLKKRLIPLLAVLLLLMVMVIAISCKNKQDNLLDSDSTDVGDSTTTGDGGQNNNGGDNIFLPPTPPSTDETEEPKISVGIDGLGGYNRVNADGTQVGTLAYLGTVGDLSAYTSVSDVVTLGNKLYVADETGKKIYCLSLTGEIEKTYSSSRKINGLATDGATLYSLEGDLDGTAVKLSPQLEKLAERSVGHTPTAMAIVGGKGYVTNRFSGTVSVVKLSDMSLIKTAEIDGREPISAVAVGNQVYVACHLANETWGSTTVSADVVILSADTNAQIKTVALVNGASGVKDICVTPDGKTVYVSHVIGRYTYPVTQMDRGWINTNGFSVIDTASQAVTCTILLDEVDHGAANPWGITVSSDGKYLCVALSGTNEVMLIDLSKMNEKLQAVAVGTHSAVKKLSDVVNYLPFLNDCRVRVTVGVGARSLWEQNGVLYCGLYYDGAVSAIRLQDRGVSKLSFVTQPEASLYRQGQILWNDATVCYQNWQSCSSCHPDTSTDGLFWDFNITDLVSFNTKSPIMAFRTPPVTFSGGVADAEEEIVLSVYGDLYNGSFTNRQYRALNEYLKGVLPTLSPSLTKDGLLTESALAGKAIFEKSCASCHPAPLYTDLEKHNVGTDIANGTYGSFDTPSLIEAWRTGPYLHDGSLQTIEEVVRYFAPDLSETEVKQVADFVRSICGADEDYGVEQVRGRDGDGTEFYNTYRAGATLTSLYVRRQTASATDRAVAVLNVYDANGKQVYYADCAFGSASYNTSVEILLGEGIVLPENGSYVVSVYAYDSGELICVPLTVK